MKTFKKIFVIMMLLFACGNIGAQEYVRISDLSEIANGSKVVIASRYNENATDYAALPTAIQATMTGVKFSSDGEMLPSLITDEIASYEWTVSIDGDNYSFTNADGQQLGYYMGSSLGADVNPTWTISKGTASETSLVPNYEGFGVLNPSTGDRYLSTAVSGDNVLFKAYFSGQMTSSSRNFYLDFFVFKAAEGSAVATPAFEPEAGSYIVSTEVNITTNTSDAFIYYTTDGTEPTETSQLYTDPFAISSTTTVKAIAMKASYENSAVAEATYNIIPLSTIAEARNAEADAIVAVEGIVTFIDGNNVFVQDNTAAINLCFNNGTVPSDLAIGDKVRVYGTKNTNNGLVELKNIDGALASQFSIVSSNNELPLAEVTVEQILNDFNADNSLQSERVKIIAATIGDINVGGTTSITQNGSSINIAKLPAVGNIQKGYYVTLTAVVGCNNNPQLHISLSDDIASSDYIVTDKTSMDLVCDEFSYPIAQALNIQGLYVNETINVTASSNFQVCETVDGLYSNKLTIAAADGVVNKTIYVRLLPYLNSGEYEGTLTIANSNATCEVSLNGKAYGLEIETLDLGYRPIGARMHVEQLKVTNTNLTPVEIYWADYFGFGFVKLENELEFPIRLESNETMYIDINTDHAYLDGVKEGEFVASIALFWDRETRASSVGQIIGVAYTPVTSDVIELAEVISALPFVKTQNVGSLYDNYILPGDNMDGNDAVYKITTESDILINAIVSNCENPKIAVYKADSTGFVTAQVDNYYDANFGLIDSDNIIPAGNGEIKNLALSNGTYYVVVSTTSESFDINITSDVIPLPEQAQVIYPADGAKKITAPVTLQWNFGANTMEYQLLFGTNYPPSKVLVDWTSDLNNSYVVESLYTNTGYFWQVNERNTSGTTMGEAWGFTTSLAVAENLQLVDSNIYPNQDVVLTWESPEVDRYTRGFNVYQDGVRINTELVTETTFTVSNLAYNMEGYDFNVTRVHDAGESAFSNTATAYVTGYGKVEGYTYEQDGVTPISGVLVYLNGTDEFGNELESSYMSNREGYFSIDVLAGSYIGTAYCQGYQNTKVYDINVEYNNTTSNVNFLIDEIYYVVNDVYAEEAFDESNVSVAWSWGDIIPESPYADFETGDFSQVKFDNAVTLDHAWEITESAYEGSYAMKSSCENVANGISSIETVVYVPFDGIVSFYHKVSSEEGADYAKFYVDDMEMASLSGETEWTKVNVPVFEGKHTYRWTYVKNESVDNGDDAYFVDNVTMYKHTPAYEGWIYYDNGVYKQNIGTSNVAPVYWGIKFPNTAEYERSTLTKVAFFDTYPAEYTINIHIGDMPSSGNLVSTQTILAPGSTQELLEIDLENPVTLDGKQALWITLYCDQLTHPAPGCEHTGDSNSDWISLNGVQWNHTTDYNLSFSWILRGYLQDMNGKVRSISNEKENVVFEGGSSSYDMIYADNNSTPKFIGLPSNEMAANNNRSFSSYKVYRHNIITGEYTAETVDLLASELSDTTYIDNEWASLEAGAYRYGVATVYEGNRNDKHAVNNAKPFVPEEGFVLNTTSTLEYDGEVVVNNVTPEMFRGRTAYANVVYPIGMPAGYSQFELDDPLGATVISASYIDNGADYYDGILYGYNSEGYYCKVDPATGELISKDGVSVIMSELAYNYANNTMYGISGRKLYTIDIETGEAQDIGIMSHVFIAFGINYFGEAYAINSPDGNLYSINLETAETTLIGATGKGANYLQCGGFDLNTNKFYWFQCYSVDDMNLYEVDIYTGAATLIAANTGEVTSWFIPFERPSDDQDLGIVYPFQDDNESPIVWSNGIDKDMKTVVNMSFETNTGESPAGTIVKLTNVSEPDENIVYTTVLGETGAYTFERVRKGVYEISVDNENFSSDLDGTVVTIMEPTTISGTLMEITEITDLYVSPTGWAMWNRADAKSLIGYTIMLNDSVVAENVLVPYYQHEDFVYNQTYTTTVQAQLTTGVSEPISYTWTASRCDKYNEAAEFTLEYEAGNVVVNWTEPTAESSEKWMTYDNGNPTDGVGGPSTFLWGIKLRAADLDLMAPTRLTKVSMFDRVESSGTLYIYLGGDDAPLELIHSQEFIITNSYDYAEFELSSDIVVDGTENLWIVFGTNNGEDYPASACSDTGDADGRWISLNGSWQDVKDLGLNFTWAIQACFNNEGLQSSPVGAYLFRNGELVTEEILTEGTYSESVVTGEEYEYCLRMLYNNEESGDHHIMSCPQCENIKAEIECTAPKKLHGFASVNENGDEGIELVWPYIVPINEWLYYDNGNNNNGIGGPQTFKWGVMFPAENIAGFEGTTLTKVSMYDVAASTGELFIYEGGDNAPETLVYSHEYSVTGSKSFVEFELTETLPLNITQNLWVVFSTNDGTVYPAACSADSGDPNGRWLSLGAGWQDLAEYGLNGTWMIRAFVTNQNGEEKTRALDHYNIYRGTSNSNFTLIDETTEGAYFDVIEEDGTYYYQVTAVYKENGEECESEPATAYDDDTQNYVVVDFVSVDEYDYDDMTVYPNPTRGDLNIKAESIQRITITNALGQILLDKEYDSDNEVIDMKQYEAGVYMLRITTDNGVSQRRITVIR